MNAEDFVRLVKVFLQAKGHRFGPEPTCFWNYEEMTGNTYDVLIQASPDFSFILASEPGHCVLRVEKGVVWHYDYSSSFVERLKKDITLELLGDTANDQT